MIRVNLLGTDRARVRARVGITEAQKITASAVLLLLLTAGYIGWTFWSMRQENARLDQEIAASQAEKERQKNVLAEVDRFEAYRLALTQRLALIDQLRRSQTGPVHMLDEISRALPDRLWLVDLAEKANVVTINGRAVTHQDVTDFVANLQNSPYFQSPVGIDSSATETDAEGEFVRFSLKATFLPGGAQPAAPAAPAPVQPGTPGRGGN